MNQSPFNRSNAIPPGPIYIGRLPSSPIGPIWVACSEKGLVAVEWSKSEADFSFQINKRFHTEIIHDENFTALPLSQLAEYLLGKRQKFELSLDLSELTDFQQQVLRLTSMIPYGQTSTYKDIAISLGKINAARAVGRAEATNPMPLVIPCHRVVGSDGSLHGYGGPDGIKLKVWLLNLEGARLK
jgi:methylated-DNA-[protein]-cysteine S-methyltransferase